METETTYNKGLNLEERFAVYLKKELGYKATSARVNIHGSLNARIMQIDIIAEQKNETKESIISWSGIIFIVGVVTLVIGLLSINNAPNIFPKADGIILRNIGIFITIICLIGYLIIPDLFKEEFTMVECNNIKGKATIEQIQKLNDALNDYKGSGNKDYNFTKLIFVSVDGFSENAQKSASEKNIDCYEMNERGEFIKSKYWEGN